jgi:hypothetical protein
MLDAPTPPPGYKFRWIREATRGQDDKSNMSKRIREGYEPVRAEDYPDFEAPSIDHGRNKGVIGVGGLILAKVPEETAKSRNDYFTQQAKTAIDGVDQNLMRESDPRMPLNKFKARRQAHQLAYFTGYFSQQLMVHLRFLKCGQAEPQHKELMTLLH